MNLEKASSAIKAAFVCGVLSTVLTLIATVIGIFHGGIKFGDTEFSAFMLIDVVLLAGFTIGLFFKSRVCASLMLIYFIWCKYLQWSVEIKAPMFIIGLAFLYFYAQGARGAFAYHKLKKKEASQPLEPTAMAATPPAAPQEPRQP
jgi:hypothetical protein